MWPDGDPPVQALTQDGGIPQPERVRIRAWAEVSASYLITDPRAIDALSPYYIWTTDYAEKRLAWKRRHPLHVMVLRTYRIPRPVTVKVKDEYMGCRSWCEIQRDLPFEGTPVMADESVFGPAEVIDLIKRRAADIINIKLMKTGGISNAIRIADMKSADLIAAKLARNHRVVCAAPAYFKRAGKPKMLADLARHNCLVTSTEDGVADQWSFQEKGKPVTVKVGGNLQCNDGEVLTRWAISGEGLAWRSAWEVSEEVKKGRLVSVLDEFAVPGNNVYAVFPERRLLPAKVRFFIEHLKKIYARPGYWLRDTP